jgi:hypothetical protein
MTDKKDLFDLEPDKSLLNAFGWWEKRRWIYNLVVGLTGAFFLFLMPMITAFDVLGIILYGLLANLCYSTGFLLEAVARYYFKNVSDFSEKRKLFFGAGLVLSVVITALLAFAWGLLSTGHPS